MDESIYSAMRSLGWVRRLDEESLRKDERQYKESATELPAELSDPGAIIRKIRERHTASKQNIISLDQSTADNLARAAREGSKITPEIEERMRRDRNTSESQTNQGYDDLYE